VLFDGKDWRNYKRKRRNVKNHQTIKAFQNASFAKSQIAADAAPCN
jgi:hypothetical protein